MVLPSGGTWRVLRPLPVSAARAGRWRRMPRTARSASSWTLGPGVVERGEQGRVAPALAGGPVGRGEQAARLPGGQVADGRAVRFLDGDGEDVLPAGHPGRVLGLHPRAERADRGQPLVAGRDAVVPFFLQ